MSRNIMHVAYIPKKHRLFQQTTYYMGYNKKILSGNQQFTKKGAP